MKLIVGLGNPGLEYKNTKHNVGFIFLDYLRKLWGFEDFKDSKFKGVISVGVFNSEKIILLKPMTYMNLSGESVANICNFYKMDFKKDIFVVCDDISMEFGKVRFREKGRHGGHNGIKFIIEQFGTDEFKRIKIGVGFDENYDAADWVLSNFKKEELKELNEIIFDKVVESLK